MWQNWLSGFLGLAVIVVTWLNVSLALEHWLLIAIGLAVAVLNFWMVAGKKESLAIGSDQFTPPAVN